jgi:hypothetical protein
MVDIILSTKCNDYEVQLINCVITNLISAELYLCFSTHYSNSQPCNNDPILFKY